MSVASWVAMGWMVIVALQAPAVPKETPPDLLVEASVSTAGPYGERWYLTLTPNAGIALQVFYRANPSGSMMARFTIHDEYMNALREAIVSERFFDLPKEISPESSLFHQPALRLEVTLGGRKRKVLLYDPNELKDDPNAQRFLKVWTRLFEGLPLKPSW